ncbi:MAG: pyridoxal phosphate-dependent aminotransferase [Saprospiraceae bacterium]|uniref:Aminotransferase n=1 Tax=Candidatus Opimibacter skivensis TaxID=2982028 RepID=A0A9D7SV66_9BACT|nr:pyridoxal phosphate-dependent aminotransferase [Candidatus Opimibacter skivensis]
MSTLSLSRLVLEMQESATLKMAKMARELKAKGQDVIDLSLGEPDFDTPAHIKEAAKKALDEGFTKYTPVNGLLELREAIVRKLARENDLQYTPNQIVVSNGAKQSVYNLCAALLDPGDEVIIPAPYWVSYYEIIKMTGGVPIIAYSNIENDFKCTADQIEALITDRTKFILYSSPCNPSGSVFSYDELKAIATMLQSYEHVLVVSDEIYEHINFADRHYTIASMDNMQDRTVIINGMSKAYAMTGWRLGYIAAPTWIAEACTKIQGQVTSGATSFGQKAAVTALDADQKPTIEMAEAFHRRRDLIIGLLEQIPLLLVNRPQGAFYIFPDVSAYFGKTAKNGSVIKDADDLSLYLLAEALVSTVSGAAFGNDRCIRLSYATSEAKLKESASRIEKALSQLS